MSRDGTAKHPSEQGEKNVAHTAKTVIHRLLRRYRKQVTTHSNISGPSLWLFVCA